MALKIYNTLSRKNETFKPLNGKNVGMYTCGPTVYNIPHIGNYRTYFMADMIKRYLRYKGYTVKHVMNLTDIDDKTIRDSAKEGIPLREFTEKYTKYFMEGLDFLNIQKSDVYPRATEHITEMLDLINRLENKGIAYAAEDGVYYNISKFKNYGKFSRIKMEGQIAGARVNVDEYDKENVHDFALWKKSTPDEIARGVYFDSPWGKGRPGWHIECSAMSMKYLGESFDIHTGAVDLIFPHHENEIAQSEGATGKKFVKYWMHGEHLIFDSEKMSKSIGNTLYLYDLKANYDCDAIRYLFLSTHYRDILSYTDIAMRDASLSALKLKNTLDNIDIALREDEKKDSKSLPKKAGIIKKKFIKAMDDDLNTPMALKHLHELSKAINQYLIRYNNHKTLLKVKEVYKELSGVFGLFEDKNDKMETDEKMINDLVCRRDEARAKKDWKTADELRDKLLGMNIILEDRSGKTIWKRKR